MALRKAEAEKRRLADSAPAFDAKVLRSALDLYNYFHADPAYRQRFDEIDAPVSDIFSWISPVLKLRAEGAAIDPNDIAWKGPQSLESFAAMSGVLLFMIGAFEGSLEHTGSITLGARRITADKWLDEVLRTVRLTGRLVRTGLIIEEVTVPCLTSPESVVAYSIALIRRDRHGLADKVRPCEFLKDNRPGALTHHYFLAEDGHQKFCSRDHANAHRQREYRRAQSKARNKK